jgi:hypothetical protein
MPNPANYDHDLHMLIETPKPVQLARLGFLRWLGEQGKLEHEIAGEPSGPLVALGGLVRREPGAA